MRTLVVNSGSSSLKLSSLSPDGTVHDETTVERWDGHELGAVERFLAGIDTPDAVGHRVVHGGPRHRAPTCVDVGLLDDLEAITALAPLHLPAAVAAMRAVGELLPRCPAVACFDTAFHSTMPAAASAYALPASWNQRFGLRRYGFHGLSHSYAARRGAEVVGLEVEEARVVSCHLGAGASLAAVDRGRSVDTTMGFTPLAGLVMATRAGDVDPGALVWLLQHGGLTVDELATNLETRSGLAGLSGTSGDMREVLAGRSAGDAGCRLAVEVFVHRLAREVAAMTAATRGLDILVITGGIGEHVPAVRAEAAERLVHLGVTIDPAANEQARGDVDISVTGAPVHTVVVTAREDIEIARQVAHVLAVGP